MLEALMNMGLSYSYSCAVMVPIIVLFPFVALKAFMGVFNGLFVH